MTGSKQIPGVSSVKADSNTKRLTLKFDPRVTDSAQVVAAVETIVANVR